MHNQRIAAVVYSKMNVNSRYLQPIKGAGLQMSVIFQHLQPIEYIRLQTLYSVFLPCKEGGSTRCNSGNTYSDKTYSTC